MHKALIPPETGRVTSQAKMIDRKRDQSTFLSSPSLVMSPPNIQPTKTTLPTIQCVLEMGMPSLLASSTVIAADDSTVNPLLCEKMRRFMYLWRKWIFIKFALHYYWLVSSSRASLGMKMFGLHIPIWGLIESYVTCNIFFEAKFNYFCCYSKR